uniref:Elongation factor 1-beta n=1 Tax=Macrostomum lignano TaxID=282301 RepID=A0A1I8JS85_9PLAT
MPAADEQEYIKYLCGVKLTDAGSSASGDDARIAKLEADNKNLAEDQQQLWPPTPPPPAVDCLTSRIAELEKKFAALSGRPAATAKPAAPPQQAAKAEDGGDDDDDVDPVWFRRRGGGRRGRADQAGTAAGLPGEKVKEGAGPGGQSSIVLDVKPWDDETVTWLRWSAASAASQPTGCCGGAPASLVPVGYGIKEAGRSAVLSRDDKGRHPTSWRRRSPSFEDLVQSVDRRYQGPQEALRRPAVGASLLARRPPQPPQSPVRSLRPPSQQRRLRSAGPLTVSQASSGLCMLLKLRLLIDEARVCGLPGCRLPQPAAGSLAKIARNQRRESQPPVRARTLDARELRPAGAPSATAYVQLLAGPPAAPLRPGSAALSSSRACIRPAGLQGWRMRWACFWRTRYQFWFPAPPPACRGPGLRAGSRLRALAKALSCGAQILVRFAPADSGGLDTITFTFHPMGWRSPGILQHPVRLLQPPPPFAAPSPAPGRRLRRRGAAAPLPSSLGKPAAHELQVKILGLQLLFQRRVTLRLRRPPPLSQPQQPPPCEPAARPAPTRPFAEHVVAHALPDDVPSRQLGLHRPQFVSQLLGFALGSHSALLAFPVGLQLLLQLARHRLHAPLQASHGRGVVLRTSASSWRTFSLTASSVEGTRLYAVPSMVASESTKARQLLAEGLGAVGAASRFSQSSLESCASFSLTSAFTVSNLCRGFGV